MLHRLSSPYRRALLAALLGLVVSPPAARAETATVAVAANFTVTLERLAADFAGDGAHAIRIVTGSTGKLYTQILHGAPFDLFLAADTLRPDLLVSGGQAQDRRTYAVGRLALWSREGEASEAALRTAPRLAIPNPDLAPYGAAAMEVLAHFGRVGADAPALVTGENVGQALAMLATGNVDHGLVPLSIRVNPAFDGLGHLWPIPAEAHAPVRQDAVLLKRGARNPAAVAFFAFLGSQAARAIIVADGYEQDGYEPDGAP